LHAIAAANGIGNRKLRAPANPSQLLLFGFGLLHSSPPNQFVLTVIPLIRRRRQAPPKKYLQAEAKRA
jgi:hypothetical protein